MAVFSGRNMGVLGVLGTYNKAEMNSFNVSVLTKNATFESEIEIIGLRAVDNMMNIDFTLSWS